MDENLPQVDPPIETEQIPEDQAIPEQKGISNLGNIPVLLSSLTKSVFGPADYLENDRRYKKIVRENYDLWAKNNPGKFNGKLFVRTNSGNLIINPALEEHLPTLGVNSQSQFAKLNPKRAELYRKIEQKRFYLDQNDDPAIKRLQKNEERQKAENQHYKEFVNTHPEKARYYANQDPRIKAAFEEYKQEEWSKKSRGGRIFTRLNNSQLVPEAERKSWMPKRMRKASDWYDGKRDDTKKWFSKSKAGRLIGWNKLQQNRLSQWYQDKKSALKQRLSKTRIGRAYLKYTSFKEYLANKKEEIKDRLKKYLFRKLIPKRLQQLSPKQLFKKLVGKIVSAIVKRLPGLAGLIGRGLLGIKQFGGALLRQSFKGLQKATGALLKKGTQLAVQTASRVAAGTLVSTAPFWGQAVLIFGVVLFFIALFVAVYVVIFGGGADELNTDTTVSITKTGPTGVPDEKSQIIYSIKASANSATNMTVTDYIPENATYISSTPQGKLYDALNAETTEADKTSKVVWSLGNNSTTTGPGGNAQPTSSTNQASALSQIISITLQAKSTDTYVLNKASVTATGGKSDGGGNAPPGVDVPPNEDTCNGTYTLDSGQHNGKNFGDPTCDLAQGAEVSSPLRLNVHGSGIIDLYPKQMMVDEIKKNDSNYERWVSISACEAPGFDPNNWTSHELYNTPDVCGAWGLFQVGSNEQPEGNCSEPYKIPGAGRNGEFDRGDVNWRTQIYNAASYGKLLDNQGIPLGEYWECAQ